MDELGEILGADPLDAALECCCLGELADDAAPTQSEADAQNRKILAKVREQWLAQKRYARRHRGYKPRLQLHGLPESAELGKISLGRALVAGITGGASEVVRGGIKVGKALAGKGKGKGGLKAGASAALDVAGGLLGGDAESACEKLAALKAAKQRKLVLQLAPLLPHIKIHAMPCGGSQHVAGQVALKIAPEMKRIRLLLDKMALQHKATSEHNARKRQNKWRKEVIGLLGQVREKRCHA